MSRAKSKRLGLLAPSYAPEFEIVRKPLWVHNETVPASGIDTMDPITNVGSGALYHYQAAGASFIRHPWNSILKFEAGDYFGFKAYFKPRSVTGRVLLYSNKGGLRSGGPFVDMVDGVVRLGWYDTVQKREVFIATDVPVVRPGRWHCINMRKVFPAIASGSGCWSDTIHARTTGSARDLFIVREMALASGGAVPLAGFWPAQPTWISKPIKQAVGTGGGAARDSVSFTTDLEVSIAGCTAKGLVSRSSATYTGAAAGVITASQTITAAQTGFTGATIHQNMLWQWSTANGKAFDGKIYVVVAADFAANIIKVIDPDTGISPDFSAYTAGATGGIFSGVRLIKSEGFETAVNPGTSSHDIEVFGSHLAENVESGITPYTGEFSSYAFMVVAAAGANPDLFESGAALADDGQIGTDGWDGYSLATPWAALQVDNGFGQVSVDTRQYGGAFLVSSVPNEKLEVTMAASASAAIATPTWERSGPTAPESGRYEVSVSFYDPEQADVTPPSAPSPTLVVLMPGEDKSNPSGFTGLRLRNLPVSRDGDSVQRWVYMSEVNRGERFRVAVVPDNVSTEIVVSDLSRISGRGPLLETDNGPPPPCSFLSATQGVLAFCGVRGSPDLVVWSKPFFVGAVPFIRNIFQVPSGASQEITGVADFNGRLLVFKRDAVYRAVLGAGSAVYDLLTREMGCVSHSSILTLQNKLYWVGEQGLCLYTGAGLPYWVSAKLESFFNDGVDQQAAAFISAAINRRRNQVVLSVRETGAVYQNHRVSAEFARVAETLEDGHRFGRYDDPGATVLASLRDKGGQTSRLIAGTDDGFAVWMDRQDTSLVMLGPTDAWGDSVVVANAGATSTRIPLKGTPLLDADLAGMRGARVRWGSRSAVILLAEASALHLDRATAPVPIEDEILTIGVLTRYWRTKWLDLGAPASRKRGRHLDVTFTRKFEGTVSVNAYEDFGSSQFGDQPEFLGDLDMTRGFDHMAIDKVQARFVLLAFSSTSPFELAEVIIRLSDADVR